MTSSLTIDVRRVHPAPGKRRLVWIRGRLPDAPSAPGPTDGGVVTDVPEGRRSAQAHSPTGTVSNGAALVNLHWKQAPEGRTKPPWSATPGSDVVAASCSGVRRGPRR